MTPSIALPSVYREAVNLFASGKSPDLVLENLINKGMPESYARNLMTAAFREAYRTSDFSAVAK
jgi:hypothetical protein